MKRYLGTAAVMLVFLTSIAALTMAVMTALSGLTVYMMIGGVRPFGPYMDMEPRQAFLAGVAWIALLVFWSIIATVIGGALYQTSQTMNETARRLEHRAGLKRRYSAGELDAQEYDPIERDRAA